MLGLVLSAYLHKQSVGLDHSKVTLAVVGLLTLGGVVLLNLGGWLGGRVKGTKKGRVAVVLWFTANFIFALFSFLDIMYGQDF